MAPTKEQVKEKKTELLRLTSEFSKRFLNEEYDEIIEKLINKMARKREVPFGSGRIDIWAAAVIHALGTINFLFDKSSQPYVAAQDIYEYFGTKQTTTSQKSKKIRDMFNMTYFDNEFSIDSVEQSSPFNNLSIVNGFIVPMDRVEEKNVETEDWEIEIAQILGAAKLERGKKYKESHLYSLFNVNEEGLIRFYKHLEERLTFPFTASYEEETGPFEITEFAVNCIRLDQVMKVDEFYGILVECRMGRRKVILPLADINVDEGHTNLKWLELYHDWFWTYR